MGVQVVLNQNDDLGARKMNIARVLEQMGVIDGRPALDGLDVAPAFERADSMNGLAAPLRLYS